MMNSRTTGIIIGGAIILLLTAPIATQDTINETPADSEITDAEITDDDDDDRSFSFSSDRTIVVFSEGREKTTLVGNATVTSDTTQLRANYIEVYGEDFRFVDCEGDVEVLDEQEGYRLKTDSLFFDRELEIMRGRGSNVMEDFDNEIVIKGEFVEHRNTENRSEIQVGTRILGEDITATAEFVRYQRDTQILEFSGLPLVEWKGDQYQAARIIVDMDDDTVDLQGEVYGEIEIEDEEEETPTATETEIEQQADAPQSTDGTDSEDTAGTGEESAPDSEAPSESEVPPDTEVPPNTEQTSEAEGENPSVPSATAP